MFEIGGRRIGPGSPTYFIADIAANHDGSLSRALDLVALAHEAGADAAKFQHFRAPRIVSDYGFSHLGGPLSHQASWKKSVFETFRDASISWDWTPQIAERCAKVGIHFFSSPYDFEAVDHLEPYVPAYKIGSGDVTWGEMISYIAGKGKPVLLATGASTLEEVIAAVETVRKVNPQLLLMQCNTNYTAASENFAHISLNVLKTYAALFPGVELGLSDHSAGHVTVLGAVALGACAIEKHFTDDNSREGPDHPFSMNPKTWREMVDRTRELEAALGTAVKKIEDNERQTAIAQRRCLRAGRSLKAGEVIARESIDVLRPAPPDSLRPGQESLIVGRRARRDIEQGEHFTIWSVEP
jgi:sialic acid synthase SpsE